MLDLYVESYQQGSPETLRAAKHKNNVILVIQQKHTFNSNFCCMFKSAVNPLVKYNLTTT